MAFTIQEALASLNSPEITYNVGRKSGRHKAKARKTPIPYAYYSDAGPAEPCNGPQCRVLVQNGVYVGPPERASEFTN